MKVFAALASATWKYSAGRRHVLVLYVLMFVTANVIYLFEPFVIGMVLNSVQEASNEPGSLQKIFTYLVMIVGINVAFWLFHGPARVMERASLKMKKLLENYYSTFQWLNTILKGSSR